MKRIAFSLIILTALLWPGHYAHAQTYGAVTVTNSATLVHATTSARRGFTLYNNGSVTIYCGFDTNITSSNAIPVPAGVGYEWVGDQDAYRGLVYCITASSTADVRWWEWTK